MKNRWNDEEVAGIETPVELCAYASRLLGADQSLVLHGGGNTSVKSPWRDITGIDVEALWVKASGFDLATIPVEGFTPLRLSRLAELLRMDHLDDLQMVNEFAAAQLDPRRAPASVETLVHAAIPAPYVLHSHADAFLSISKTPHGASLLGDTLGTAVLSVPYVMPGFDLGVTVSKIWADQGGPDIVGLALIDHGLFTFGATAREAYDRHIELVGRTEALIPRAASAVSDGPSMEAAYCQRLAELRALVSTFAGRPLLARRDGGPETSAFLARPDWRTLVEGGPLTPDHVIRVKPRSLIGTDVAGYAAGYTDYFEAQRATARTGDLTMLDPAPRQIIDEELGLVTLGETATDTNIARDIALHTFAASAVAAELGGYVGLSDKHLFDMEYWDLEQAKLRRRPASREFSGEIAIVTGAASGIGRRCVEELLTRGSAVVGVDRSSTVGNVAPCAAYLGIEADVTDLDAMTSVVSAGVERYGGVDIVVLAAGIFGPSRPIVQSDPAEWANVVAVNAGSVVQLLALLYPLLVIAPRGGRVVLIGSKNVPAPGPGAVAYSASKAAATQVARVAALEWASDGIRVNTVHPDAVFDTGLWTAELIEDRAAHYGLSAAEYRTRNLLGHEVTSATVASVVADLCGDHFGATTGAQIPIDGGSNRVI